MWYRSYTYPPPSLLNRFVGKARTDEIRAIVVTPLAVAAPYWNKLLRASVVPGEDGFLRMARQQSAPQHSDCSEELAVFAVDFSSGTIRRSLPPCAPSCGAEATFRGRPPLGSLLDQEDRARIRQRIATLGLALRPSSPSPDPPVPPV